MNSMISTAMTCGAAGLAVAPLVLRWSSPFTTVPHDPRRAALVTAALGVLLAVVGWCFAPAPTLVIWCWLAVTGLGVGLIDLDCHRLPRPWVGAMLGGGLAGFTVVAFVRNRPEALLRGLAAAILVAVTMAVVQWLLAAHMGFGDTTLYGALALYTGWVSWRAVYIGIAAGVVLLGVVAAVLLLSRRRSTNSRIAAGPALVAGAWFGIALG